MKLTGRFEVINAKVGIIGSGKIGEALIKGLISSKKLSRKNLCASDVREERRRYISKKYLIECLHSNLELVEKSEVVILAVKPTDVKKVLQAIRDKLTDKQLLISIAAGVTIDFILKILGKPIPVVRGMPNLPVLVREGMTVLSSMNGSEEHLALAREIFESVGKVVFMEEKYMNAVTGLSGSGPAYIFMVIEALVEAGVKVGIPRETSTLLAAQTTLGAAKMILETEEHPALLREMVTTPGGVTIDGIIQLEEGKLRTSIINAVVKATERSRELVMNG
ncbi:MAG: pyrroline-5-carboxylate reductase [Thermoproteota archaeon]